MEVEVKEISCLKYPEYTNTRSWLEEVPTHWKLLPGFVVVSEQCTKNVGLVENTVLSLSYGSIIIKDEERVTGLVPESFETYQIVNPNDIIIRTMDLQNDKTSLRIGISPYRGIISSAYLNLRVKKGYDPKYIYYFLHTVDITKVIYGLGSGLRQNLSFLDLKRFAFLVPPPSEQTAIARFLDRKTAQIDKAIAQKEKLIELLKERRQILIHNAVTKGLNLNVKMKDSGVEWIGEIPEHWEAVKVKQIYKLVIDPAPKNNDFELLSLYTEIGVRPRAELEEKGNKASTTDGYWLVRKGDIVVNKLLAWMGAIGISNYEGVTSPAYDILRPKRKVDGNYFHNLFRTQLCISELRKHSRGIMDMRLRLYFDRFGSVYVPFPPLSEQNEISIFIEKQYNKIEEVILLHREAIEKLNEYKLTLINSVVTGKITVPDLEAMD
jgi:type I restriction enzyme S subunit